MGPRITRNIGIDRHPHPVAAVAADRRVDRPGARRRVSRHQRQVLAADLAIGQHLRERAMDRITLGHHHQAGRVAVQPVHESRPPGLVASGSTAGQRLRQRPGPVPAGRMDDHPGRFVDDQQVLVLIGHRERHIDRFGFWRLDAAIDLDPLPRADRMALGPRATVDADPAGIDQRLGAGSRAQRSGQEAIEPDALRLIRPPRRPPSSTNSSANPPNVIAVSAKLNAGHSGSLTKSVTDPWASRSIRLPSAPPTSRPQASHSQRRAGCRMKNPTNAESATRVTTSTTAPPPARKPNATPLLVTWTRFTPGRTLWASPTAIPDRTACLVT